MPLPMVHLLVADSLDINMEKSAEFYLGAISPDAVHMREDYIREHKTTSHFGIKNVGSLENLKELINLIDKEADKGKKEFLYGYLVHLLTDKLWLDTLYIDVFLNNYNKDKNKAKDNRSAYYNDTDQIDYMLYKYMPKREEIWQKLEISKVYGIDDIIRSENVYMWKIRNLNWFNNDCAYSDPIKYIKYEDVIKFSEFSAAEIKNLFRTLME